LVQHYGYLPFGNERYKNNTQAFRVTNRYTGQQLDEDTGLYFYGSRYYDPALARFIQPDSLVPGSGSQALNRYSYTYNNPLIFTDPTGNVPTYDSYYYYDMDYSWYMDTSYYTSFDMSAFTYGSYGGTMGPLLTDTDPGMAAASTVFTSGFYQSYDLDPTFNYNYTESSFTDTYFGELYYNNLSVWSGNYGLTGGTSYYLSAFDGPASYTDASGSGSVYSEALSNYLDIKGPDGTILTNSLNLDIYYSNEIPSDSKGYHWTDWVCNIYNAFAEGGDYGIEVWQNAGSFTLYNRYGLTDTNSMTNKARYGGNVEIATEIAGGISVAALYSATILKSYNLATKIRYELHAPHPKGPHQYPHIQEIQGPGWGDSLRRWPASHPWWWPKP
jgi:RHS repeat-associated protein